jgi:hypothetical protein
MNTKNKLLSIFLSLLAISGNSQGILYTSNKIHDRLSLQPSSNGLFKFKAIFGLKKGYSIALSYGFWQEHPTLQYSLNTGVMWRVRSKFLGNYRDVSDLDDSRSKSQFIFMFSPMLSINLCQKETYVYQELEPFYFGTANAVFSRYKHSITVGSTFTVSPRGTYKNVATPRNRAQQDIMFSVNIKDFNFTLYDDYFPILTEFFQLGDNWDRFFTGGGFLRYRLNDQFTFHLYSEVYTGINRANPFVYPDIISYKYKRKNWRRKNYANQDPKQEYFNTSWLIAKVSYSAPQVISSHRGMFIPDVDIVVGSSAQWTMFSQNLIHSMIKYDPANKLKLHYFLPRSVVPGNLEAGGSSGTEIFVNSLFIGAGFKYNIFMK